MFKKVLIVSSLVMTAMVGFFAVNEQAVANNSPESKASAQSVEPSSAKLNVERLKATIEDKLGLIVKEVEKTPVPGIALLITEQGIFYASYNGDYLIQGKLYSLADSVTNLSEQSLAKVRLLGMEQFKNDMIVYKAKDEKHVVTVFTDITCGYCRKMHNQMDEYNALGITFRYLAYPRAGVTDQTGNFTEGFKDLRSVWCDEDPNLAMTNAKNGQGIGYRVCDKPIEAEFDFGRQVGVNGTPAIILSNGMMIPGYQPPEKLVEILQTL